MLKLRLNECHTQIKTHHFCIQFSIMCQIDTVSEPAYYKFSILQNKEVVKDSHAFMFVKNKLNSKLVTLLLSIKFYKKHQPQYCLKAKKLVLSLELLH